ncbi:DsbA family protein [Actinoplanes sp. TBRC 11911]|uniref:mycothiol-dependent nitroreductase Rv2466c family protein n=1 Tax=Actinoplanes sp. TBRC 11911 TaxID=2729386 RepID=UPI00145DD397|nr:DsbA family protein [Actinoplanes sp. TBRC 11911]NMO53938.1 DsbA family protein [Actinoplanes sp. TBRC 11911]
MRATFFFDPVCPFTWRTSRWLLGVAAERDVTIHWRPISLAILNNFEIETGEDGGDNPYRPMMIAAFKAHRLVEALRVEGRDDTIGVFYTEMGARTHEAGAALSDEIVVQAAEAAGIDDPKSFMNDNGWDESVRASHQTAMTLAGPDIGSPVVHVDGAKRGLHGPIIAEVPTGAEALQLWDLIVPLMRMENFFEVKRGRG